MKLPLQAPPVIRETYTWQARPTTSQPSALLPAGICCAPKKYCSDNTHEWCCDPNLNCGTYANRCTGL